MRGIGNRADAADETTGTATIFGLLRSIVARLAALLARLVGGVVSSWPTAAAGVTMTSGTADTWDGAAATIAAASAITAAYQLVSIHIDTPSAACAGIYEIGYGATPTYIVK